MTVADRRAFLGVAAAAVAGVAVVGTVAGTTGLLSGHASAAADLAGVAGPQFTELMPFKDALRIPPTLRPKRTGVTEVDMVEARVRLHSQLPPSRLWTYGGHFPGPTIDVHRGQLVRIAWTNKLSGTTPVKAVWVRGEGPGPGKLPYNAPGAADGFARPEIDALTAWTTVHVHGGHQQAGSDGAAEYGITPGNAQLGEYVNDQAAAHLFYHDHAMSVTALNVLSGLFGHYVIRDDEEDRLDLPRGRYEIPLAIGDVNFDLDAQGLLTGQLLGKRVIAGHRPAYPPGTIPASIPFFGPFTMVNGVVWPHLEVEAAQLPVPRGERLPRPCLPVGRHRRGDRQRRSRRDDADRHGSGIARQTAGDRPGAVAVLRRTRRCDHRLRGPPRQAAQTRQHRSRPARRRGGAGRQHPLSGRDGVPGRVG